MDKLAPERKAEIKKMSVFILVTKLEQAGVNPEQLDLMDRNALLEAWAEMVLVGGVDKVTAAASKPVSSTSEIERQRLQLDIDRFGWEQEEAKRRDEEEVALRRAEIKIREDEQELRRLELIRLKDRDAKEAERQNTPASKIPSSLKPTRATSRVTLVSNWIPPRSHRMTC